MALQSIICTHYTGVGMVRPEISLHLVLYAQQPETYLRGDGGGAQKGDA